MIRVRGVSLSLRLPGLLLALLLGLSAARYWQVSRSGEGEARAAGAQPRPELLVETAWLRAHLADPGLRVIDLRPIEEYRKGHVPGAVYFAIEDLFAVVNGVAGMLPPLPQVEAALRRAGITAKTVVVAYDGGAGVAAARLFWVLDYLGQGNGRLMDGGWAAWAQAGYPGSTEIPAVSPSDFRARPQADKIADLEWVKSHLGKAGVVYVDARSPEEYAGSQVFAQRGGHIPGAVSLDWSRHLRDDGRFRDPAELAAAYRALGVTPDKTAVPYCQVLARGAHAYFTLRWLGYPDVRGYDGSWSEWGNRDDTPVETGPPKVGAAPPAASPAETPSASAPSPRDLQPGITLAQARNLLGEPDQVEIQNPCWGEQAIWRYTAARTGGGPLRLTFADGRLRTIEMGR